MWMSFRLMCLLEQSVDARIFVSFPLLPSTAQMPKIMTMLFTVSPRVKGGD